MNRLKFRSRRLMLQYFFSYLVLMLLILSLLLVFAYNSFYEFHSEKLTKTYLSELELLRRTNENELSQLASMTSMFTAASDFSPFIYAQEPEKAVRLIRQLSVYRGTNDFIRGIYVRFYGDDYVYASSNSYLTKNFVNKAARFEKMTADEVIRLMENTNRLTFLPEQGLAGYLFNSQNIVTQVIPVFIPITYSPSTACGTALYLIEKQTYTDMFVNISSVEKDIYILDGNDVLVERNVSGIPYAQVLSVAAVTASGQSAPLQYNGKDYRLLRLDGDTMNYGYVMLIPSSELSVAVAGTMQAFFLAASFVAALGLLLITLFVQSRIKPIRLLHSMLSTQKPSGNELMEIKQSVQRLIDENAALNMRMEDVENLRKADFARRFLTADFLDSTEYLSFAERIQLNVDFPYFMVCILAKPVDSEYDILPEKLNRLFDQSVSGVSRGFFGGTKSILLAFSSTKDGLAHWLENKFDGMRMSCMGLTMAISGAHTDWREGPHAYLEAESAFENRFLKGNTVVIHFDERIDMDAQKRGARKQSVELLHTALRSGDDEQVSRALENVSREMREIDTSLFVFRCMYNDILYIITSEAREMGIADKEMYDLFSLSQCLSLDDLDVLLHNACKKLIEERGNAYTVNTESKDAAKAMDIISRRFSEPSLSVSAIAQELGMSDSRLSIEFKKAYQLTPMEHLTACRMKLARKLLRTTKMPVKDIAVECGYYEISGFNRRFKTYTGMTPLKYRQSHHTSGGDTNE